MTDVDLILGMFVYLIKQHILRSTMSRSRSSSKVKGKKTQVKSSTLTLTITYDPMEIDIWCTNVSHKAAHFEWLVYKVKVILKGQI